MTMARIPSQVENLLNEVTTNFKKILQNNLSGIYLYGSLTQRAFNPARSDIDCIVVTHRVLTTGQFTNLKAWLAAKAKFNPWVKRLQMTFLLRNELLIRNSPSCLYQFGRLEAHQIRRQSNHLAERSQERNHSLRPAPESFVPENHF